MQIILTFGNCNYMFTALSDSCGLEKLVILGANVLCTINAQLKTRRCLRVLFCVFVLPVGLSTHKTQEFKVFSC